MHIVQDLLARGAKIDASTKKVNAFFTRRVKKSVCVKFWLNFFSFREILHFILQAWLVKKRYFYVFPFLKYFYMNIRRLKVFSLLKLNWTFSTLKHLSLFYFLI